MRRRAFLLLTAAGLDLALGDVPNRWHPVAWLGNGVDRLGARLPRGSRRRDAKAGATVAIVFPVIASGAAFAAGGLARRAGGLAGLVLEAYVLKQTFSVRELLAHAAAVRDALSAGDLEQSRRAVSFMVSRDTATLDAPAAASAAIESLTENASDSAVAPWLWFALLGTPAAAAYRAVNTLDAMVGYRRHGWYGAPSARLDDLLNLIPARLTAAAITAASALSRPGSSVTHAAPIHTPRSPTAVGEGGRGVRAYGRHSEDLPTWNHRPLSLARLPSFLHDAHRTASPNSGWPMAAAAHALGLRLEKHGHHVLNADGQSPGPADIDRALRLVACALGLAGAGSVVLAARRSS